jgi:hypothetical protein
VYELNRARLVGIGPGGARYTDVTLDLSGVGAGIERQTLFDDPVRRPSPYTLLMLENGGGKSVLLSLLFSVVLPGKKKTVGGAALEKFVLDSDTGHVALEWMHVRTGARLVTAKVYQRRTPTPGNTSPLREAWYSFHPSTSLDLATLPVADGDRRRRFEGYQDTVEQADRAAPNTQLVWLGDDQRGWRKHLRENGIEPDLFDIQRSMNEDEGDAADAFKFSSSKAFVDWLLRTVTDPEDAASVAVTFEEWATTLADRARMLLERDFLEGAVAGLDPLAEAWRTHTSAEQAASKAFAAARDLNAALIARRDEENARAETLQAEAALAQDRAATADKATRDARDTRNEIQLQTLRLEQADVDAAQRAADAALAEVERELNGWDTVPLLQQLTEADAEARSLAEQVADADRGAADDLSQRDAAAGRLLAKLDAEVAVNDTEAAALHEQAQDEREAAEEARREWGNAKTAAAVAQHRHQTASTTAAQADAAIEAAAEAGLIPPRTRAGEVAGLLRVATAAHEHERSALSAVRERVDTVTAQIAVEEDALPEATERLAVLVRLADAAQTASADAEAAASRIASLPAVLARAGDRHSGDMPTDRDSSEAGSLDADGSTDLLALKPDELDAAADTLQAVLAADVEAHTEQHDLLRDEQRDDTRVLQALGEGGLLPPREDVVRTVDVLTDAGVAAHPGWRYLRDAAAVAQREALISIHPELADGVVLVDTAQLAAAHRAIEAARLLPAAAVVVGTGAALLSTAYTDTADRTPLDATPSEDPVAGMVGHFVVPPSPALYDEDAAEQTRASLLEDMTARSHRIEDIGQQLAEARDARDRLARWRQDNPAGHLAKLKEDASAKAAAADQVRLALQERRKHRADLVRQKASAESDLAERTRGERAASDRVQELDRLAERVRAGAEATALLPGIVEEISDAEADAARADERRDRHQQAVEENVRRAEQAHAQAQRNRAACDDVISTDGSRASDVPDDPLHVLEAQARAAQVIYLAAAADPDLRARAEQAGAKARDERSALALRAPQHVAEGRRLLASPAGADRAGWATALSNARRRHQQLRADKDRLITDVGRLLQAISQQRPESGTRWCILPADKIPTSVAHGDSLAREAAVQLRLAQTALETARAAADVLDTLRKDVDAALQGLREATLPLKAVLGTAAESACPAYNGSISEANDASEAAVGALNETRSRTAATKHALDAATDELAQFTHQDRYDDMPNPVRRSILGTDRSLLGARAEEWASLLRARHASLVTDLESADRHRKTIVERLSALVAQALKTLRQATKLSRLPDDLGDWAGRSFLRISFTESDLGAIQVRVGAVVDELADDYAARTTPVRARRVRRDGMGLLLEAVHAAVPKGFAVDVLKPDSVLRDERVAVNNMKEIFSGGQELTAAIVLYCTLAALRANQRGQMRAKHSGVLFLDNPIGKASATYLLDVQQAVARSLGVQLIYTTGLFEDRVLASFPLWIRMRNDADLRAGLKHIRVADVVARALPDAYTDGELEASGATGTGAPGTVTATRVYRREASPDDHGPKVVTA